MTVTSAVELKIRRLTHDKSGQVATGGNSVRDRESVAIAPHGCTTIQQGQGRRPYAGARQDSTPPILPNLARTASQDAKQTPHVGSCQLADEGPSLLRPSAADFSCQHDQSRATLGPALRRGLHEEKQTEFQRSVVVSVQRKIWEGATHTETCQVRSGRTPPPLISIVSW